MSEKVLPALITALMVIFSFGISSIMVGAVLNNTDCDATHFGKYTVYDSTIWSDKQIDPLPGMYDAKLLSAFALWNHSSHYGKYTEIDWDHFQTKIEETEIDSVSGTYEPMIIDIEGDDPNETGANHWNINSNRVGIDITQQQYEDYKDHWIEIIQFAKSHYAGPVGIYAYLPGDSYFNVVRIFSVDPDNVSYQTAYDGFRNNAINNNTDVAAVVDFINPSLYTFYDNDNRSPALMTAREEWNVYAREHVEISREAYPGKPVYPYVWGYFHTGGGKPSNTEIPQDYFAQQLDTLHELNVDGIIVFKTSGNDVWNDDLNSFQWYDALDDGDFLYDLTFNLVCNQAISSISVIMVTVSMLLVLVVIRPFLTRVKN